MTREQELAAFERIHRKPHIWLQDGAWRVDTVGTGIRYQSLAIAFGKAKWAWETLYASGQRSFSAA